MPPSPFRQYYHPFRLQFSRSLRFLRSLGCRLCHLTPPVPDFQLVPSFLLWLTVLFAVHLLPAINLNSTPCSCKSPLLPYSFTFLSSDTDLLSRFELRNLYSVKVRYLSQLRPTNFPYVFKDLSSPVRRSVSTVTFGTNRYYYSLLVRSVSPSLGFLFFYLLCLFYIERLIWLKFLTIFIRKKSLLRNENQIQ